MRLVGRLGAGRRGMLVGAVATALVLAVALGACGSSSSKSSGTPSFSNPSKPIEVKVGQHFEVRLSANASTGYSWRVGQTLPTLVKQTGARYVAPRTDRVGASGTAVISFQATKRGKGGLALAYVGPGTSAPTARTATFQITVS